MGIFTRLSDILNANIHAMLDKVENPEKVVRLMIQEMEDTLVEARSSAAQLLADKKKLERQLEIRLDQIKHWEQRAELAVRNNRDDLAEAALTEKSFLETALEEENKQIDFSRQELSKLNSDMAQLERKLEEARAKQKTMILKAQNYQNRLKVKSSLHQQKFDSAYNRFEAYQQKLDMMEGRLEAFDMNKEQDLDREFAELENKNKIKQQLAEHDVIVEEYGGTTQVAEVSAHTGDGIDDLLEKVLIEAELLELKANPNRLAQGIVLESRIDKGLQSGVQ